MHDNVYNRPISVSRSDYRCNTALFFKFYRVRTVCVLTLAALFTVFCQGPRALGIPSSLLVGVSRHAPGVMKDSEGKFVVPKVDL